MWFDILKIDKTRHFLFEVFNIPFDADITLPKNLLQSFQTASNENLITEQRLLDLLALSNQGKYQEVVDSLAKMLKDAQKQRVAEYRQTPEVKEKQKEYRQRPEVKEKTKGYSKKYEQRPEVKERRSAYDKKRRQTPEYKERHKEYQKKRWANKTPEERKKLNEYYRKRYADKKGE